MVLIQLFMLSGPVSGSYVGIWLIAVVKFLTACGCFSVLVWVHLVTALCIRFVPLQLRSVFAWDLLRAGWIGPGAPPLRTHCGPIQHFQSAVCSAGQSKVGTELGKPAGFLGADFIDMFGSLRLRLFAPEERQGNTVAASSLHVGRDLERLLALWSWGEDLQCQFCGAPDDDGHLF